MRSRRSWAPNFTLHRTGLAMLAPAGERGVRRTSGIYLAPDMDPFRFEHTYKLSRDQYVALLGLLSTDKRPRWSRLIAITVVGIACLFLSETFLLGVAVLILVLIAIAAPRFLPRTAARVYGEMLYLHGPVTYGVDHEHLWVRTSGLSAEVAWRHLSVWHERGGWLILRGNGFPMLIFPVDGLQGAGVYGQVRALAEHHAVERGRRAVRRGRLTNRSSGPAPPAAERER